MKTMIVYGSTYGFASDCVIRLSKMLDGEVVLVNALKDEVPDIEGFDQVIVGGSIYMGQIQKKIKSFCESHVEALTGKKLGLFICCGLPENFELNMKNAFPEKLLQRAAAKECFGGELRMDKMKLVHKIITRMMKKASGNKPPASSIPENITKLARVMNGKEAVE